MYGENKSSAQDLEKSGQKNKFLFTPLSKIPETGDSSNVPGSHNPKVASSNLATATTNPYSL